jgi:hypothetical protein
VSVSWRIPAPMSAARANRVTRRRVTTDPLGPDARVEADNATDTGADTGADTEADEQDTGVHRHFYRTDFVERDVHDCLEGAAHLPHHI